MADDFVLLAQRHLFLANNLYFILSFAQEKRNESLNAVSNPVVCSFLPSVHDNFTLLFSRKETRQEVFYNRKFSNCHLWLVLLRAGDRSIIS